MAAGATTNKMKDGIRRHGDGWQARVYAGKKAGKKVYVAKTFRTKKQAETWRDAKRDEYNKDGEVFEPTKLTVEEYLDQWLRSKVEAGRSPATVLYYDVAIRKHIVPEIGHLRLAKVTVPDVEGLYAALRAKGIGTRALQSVHFTLRAALNAAVKKPLIRDNPCLRVDTPAHETKEMQPLSAAEAERLLAAAQGERLYPLWLLATTTALRRGELCGLRWQDVDLEIGVLEVHQQITVVGSRNIVRKPKTKASCAAVPLLPEVIEALRSHRVRQAEDRLAAGELWHDHGLVFCQRDGKPLHPNNLPKRDFRHLLAKAGLPATVRIQDLRHTVATLLIGRQGVHPKVASALLRHARASTTLNIYSHVLPGALAQAVEPLRGILPHRGERHAAQ